MRKEIWIFSDEEKYQENSKIVCIIEPPVELSSREVDIEIYARQLELKYAEDGEEVRTLVLDTRSY